MNWRLVLIASLGVNVLLAAFAVKRASTGTTALAESTVAEDTTPLLPEVRTITQEVVVTNTLPAVELAWPRWADWVSEDWGQYRTNLLAAGCPGVTVREILRASLLRAQFAEQQAVRASVQAIFWDALARHGFEDEVGPINTAGEELEVIDRRYDELSNRVLAGLPKNSDGVDARREQRNRERQFDHLEPADREKAVALVTDYQQRRIAIDLTHRGKDGEATPEGNELRQQLKEGLERGIAGLLGPDATAEWKLRSGGQANWATGLAGLEVSPDEMRQIAEWQMEHSQSLSLTLDERFQSRYGNPTGEGSNDLGSKTASLDERIHGLIGADRFVQYQRAQDGNYQSLHAVGERFELPAATVSQAWQMQQEAKVAADQVRANADFTTAQRRDALRAIQQETQRSFESLLGGDAFYTYQRHGGSWINGLSALNAGR